VTFARGMESGMKAKARALILASGTALVLCGGCTPAPSGNIPVGYIAKVEVYGDLDRYPVRFDHDRHTDRLGADACASCHHERDDSGGGVTYVSGHEAACETCHGLEASNGTRGLTEAYHDTCLKCHEERSEEGKRPTGPQACSGCHVKQPLPDWVEPVTFEHAWHIPVMERDGSCAACHHVWDEKRGERVYVKGEEKACDTCHGEPLAPHVKTRLREAIHGACLGCHRKERAQGAARTGPVVCQGCHDPARYPEPFAQPSLLKQPRFEKADIILIGRPNAVMPGVPFNHKVHQEKTPDCIVCHTSHVFAMADYTENLPYLGERCNLCHTAAEADMSEASRHRLSVGLTPEAAYHDEKAPASCIGCHTARNTKGPKQFKSCSSCHSGEKGLEAMRKGRPVVPETVQWPENGPRIYLIQELVDRFEPVQFPHADHQQMAIECQVCHHHTTPKTGKTPRCKTCHKSAFDPEQPAKPRLVGSYHQMCLGCHRDMGMGPVKCLKCHQKRSERGRLP